MDVSLYCEFVLIPNYVLNFSPKNCKKELNIEWEYYSLHENKKNPLHKCYVLQATSCRHFTFKLLSGCVM